jgi:acyl-CoA dehydrogenase
MSNSPIASLEAEIGAGAERLFAALAETAPARPDPAGDWAKKAWTQLTQHGYLLAMADERHGGIGATWQDIWPLLSGLGRHQLALPLAETLAGTGLLAALGLEPGLLSGKPLALAWAGQSQALRVEIAGSPSPGRVLSGAGKASPAATGSAGATPEAASPEGAGPAAARPARGAGQPPGRGLRLSGRIERVAWGSQAGHLLACLPGTGLVLIALDDPAHVQIERGEDAAGLPSDTLLFDQAGGERIGHGRRDAGGDPILIVGAAARAIAMTGALESVLAQSVRHAGERVQFGRPIGRNQALQFQIAQLAGEVATARASARAAAVGLSSGTAEGFGDEALTAVAVAKLIAGEAAAVAIATGHQVHGAIGFTREHRLHRATHRLWAWRAEFGAESWWADRLGAAAIASGARGFWPALTDGSLLRS